MEGLGIDWKILIGQIVNFTILVILLKRFFYKPFVGVLEKRQKKIEEGVKKSEDAEKTLQNARMLEQEIREKSEKKTKEMMILAEKKARDQAKKIMAETEEEKKKIIQSAKKAVEQEKAAEREKREKETIDLALALSEKFLKEKVTKEQDKKIIERIVSELK